jgi:hypothetical protein
VIWTVLGGINGGILLAIVLGACLLGWRYLTGPVSTSTAYNPMTEGDSVARTVSLLRPYPCKVEGCAGMRAQRHLVCPACWKRVPKRQRADFYRTWDQFQAGSPKGYVRWLAARQKCLESLQ